MEPAVERIQNPCGGATHFHGLGQIKKTVQESAHGDLGRDAASLGATNSIGNRCHDVPARLGQLRAKNGAGEIFIAFAWSISDTNPTLALTLTPRSTIAAAPISRDSGPLGS